MQVINDALLPVYVTTPDGVHWVEFIAEPGISIYQQYKRMPNALKADGRIYKKVSFNSDSFKIVYRECQEKDLAFAWKGV